MVHKFLGENGYLTTKDIIEVEAFINDDPLL